MNWITGFHAVEEALAASRPLDRIVIARGRHGERIWWTINCHKIAQCSGSLRRSRTARSPQPAPFASSRRRRARCCAEAYHRAGRFARRKPRTAAIAARQDRGSPPQSRSNRAHVARRGCARRGDSGAPRCRTYRHGGTRLCRSPRASFPSLA